ncbi:MAG TPA: MATE family efflux transporter [Ruminiclostridium sp.]
MRLAYNKKIKLMYSQSDKITLPSLVAPIFLQNFLTMMMGSINVFMLGHYSDQAVGAVGVANQYITMLLMLYSITSSGTAIVISQYLGAKENKKSAKVSMVALMLNTLLGVILSVAFLLFSHQMVRLMNLKPIMMADAVVYIQIVGGTSVIQAILNAMFAITRSYGKANLPLYVALAMNFINILGNFCVIFRPFYIPLYGVSGVAIVQVFSSFVACLMMAFMMSRMKIGLDLKDLVPFPKMEIYDIMHIGLPAASEGLSYNLSQIVSTFIITLIGTVELTTRIYVQNIVFFVSVFGLSIGQASQIIIGRFVGANMLNEADRVNKKNLELAVCASFLLSLCLLLMSKPLMGLFTKDPQIMKIGISILTFDIFVEIGRAFNNVESNSLRGAGDAIFCMKVAFTSMWGVSVMLSYFFGVILHLGLMGVWFAFAMDEWCRAILLLRRWYSGKWKSMSLIKYETQK